MPGREAAVPAGVLPHSTITPSSDLLFFLSSELEQISFSVLSSANTVTKGRQLCSRSAAWVEASAVLLAQEGLMGSVVSLQHFRFWDIACLNVCIHLGFRLELKLVLRTLMIDDCSTEVVLLLLLVLGQRENARPTHWTRTGEMILLCVVFSRIVVADTEGEKPLQREQTMPVSPFPTPAFFILRRLCAVCSLPQLY